MKLAHLLLLSPVAFALVGCGHDRPQEARQPELTSYDARTERERVPSRPSNADVRAELEAAQRKMEASSSATSADARTEAGDASATGGPAAGPSTASGEATPEGADPERRDFDSRTRERLDRLDARARDVKAKAAKLTGTKKTELESTFRRFTAERQEAEAKLGALGRSAGSAWRSARTGLERSLDDLEATVSRMADQF